MPPRIPPGRLDAVAEDAFDRRGARHNADNPSDPPQLPYASAPSYIRAGWRERVRRVNEGEAVTLRGHEAEVIEAAMVAEEGRGAGPSLPKGGR